MARAQLILDRYEPIGTAGSGGFGTVQIAWDPRIQRKVAIKTIQLTEQDAYRAGLPGAQAVTPANAPGLGDAVGGATAGRWHGVQPWNEFLAQEAEADGISEEFEPETFHALANLPGLDEARTAAMLSDPRIVTVFDFEVRGRMAYLIMEYIEGITLTKILREYADWLTLDIVAAVFDAVAGALTTAHEGGVLHLDIKPDNILVNAKGEVKVTDFGLATLADASGAGTTGGGTIGYMPLEQMRREHLDARTDEWSLASVTYEMLTGENPFLAKNLGLAEEAIETAELVLPSLCWEDIDEQIDDVVFYALDPDRDERYASVADFAEEADKFLGDAAAGKEQLSAIVEDALGLAVEPEEQEPEPFDEVDSQRVGAFGLLKSLFDRERTSDGQSDRASGRNAMQIEPADDEDELDVADDYDEAPAKTAKKAPRKPLRDRVGSRTLAFLSVAFAVLASGAIAMFGAVNFTFLEAFGSGRLAVAVAVAVAAAGLAIVRPYIGALASFSILAIALVANGAIVPAIVLLVALAAWWFFIARESVAASNVALSSPLAGAVGAAYVVPLLAGAALRPVQAVATTAFGAVVALVLASLGTGSLLGWDAMDHWQIGDVDTMGTLVALVTQAQTWAVIASWVAAAFVQSFLSTRGKKWMEIAGLVLAVAIMGGVSIALMGPSVQLIVPLVAGFGVLLVVLF